MDLAPETVDVRWTQLHSFERTARARSIWASGPTDVYVGYEANPPGQSSNLLHYDGQAWTSVNTPSTFEGAIRDMWGSGNGELYVSTQYALWRLDGSVWTEMPVGRGDITGVGADVFVGSSTHVTHYNGAVWDTLLTVPRFVRSIYALPGPDLLVATNDSLLRWNGAAWTRAAAFGLVQDMWGRASNDLFAVGTKLDQVGDGAIWHWDGGEWAPQIISQGVPWLDAISGSSMGEAIAVASANRAVRFTGTQWDPLVLPTSREMHCLQFVSPGDVIFAGQDDKVLRLNGSEWSTLRDGGPNSAISVWMDTPGSVVVAEETGPWGISSAYRRENGAWIEDPIPTYSVVTLCGSSSDDLYATTWGGAILHFDGARWTVANDSITQPQRDISMADGAVFSVGLASSYRFDGATWTRIYSGDEYLESVWAHTAEEAFAIGYSTILHYKNGAWVSRTIDASPYDVWATPEGDAYVATDSGILRYANGVVERVTPTWYANQITGTSAIDILAAQNQYVFHFDGVLWRPGDMQDVGYSAKLGVSLDKTIFLIDELSSDVLFIRAE